MMTISTTQVALAQHFDLPVSLRIRGSLSAVFEAWTKPTIAQEWLCDRMEGRWEPGQNVYWNFGVTRQELRVLSVNQNEHLKFRWNAYGDRPETEVQLEFKDLGGEIRVTLLESRWTLSLDQVRDALDRACGWENILCRAKAWIESGSKLH